MIHVIQTVLNSSCFVATVGGGKALETIEVDNPFARYKKIRDLKEDTQYVLYIWAKTSIGPGTEYFTEDRTKVATGEKYYGCFTTSCSDPIFSVF